MGTCIYFQAGFATGVTLLLFMAALMLYTSYRILDSVKGISKYSSLLIVYLFSFASNTLLNIDIVGIK